VPPGQCGAPRASLPMPQRAWLGRPLDANPPLERLVTRTWQHSARDRPDIQAWSGLTGLREPVERLRPACGFSAMSKETSCSISPGPRGRTLPTPAPVRLVAEFDNLSCLTPTALASSAGRTGNAIYEERHLPGTVLINGFVLGIWRITRARDATA